MSQANVEIVKGAYRSFQSNDIDSLMRAMADDIRWTLPGRAEDFPTFGVRQGAEAVRNFFATVAENLEFQDFSPREFYDCGDKVFVLGHYRAKMRPNGRTADSDWVHVFTVRGGKVTDFREFTDTAAILEAWRG